MPWSRTSNAVTPSIGRLRVAHPGPAGESGGWRRVSEQGTDCAFWIDDTPDAIESVIATTGTFHQATVLRLIRRRLPAAPRIVDVGAHTGNHSVYFARFCSASWILPIEPDATLLPALRANLTVNGCAADLSQLGIAIGAPTGRRLVPVDEAAAPWHDGIATLDALVPEPVDLLRISATSGLLAVLGGALQLIARCKPLILADIGVDELPAVADWVRRARYRIAEALPEASGVITLILEALVAEAPGTSDAKRVRPVVELRLHEVERQAAQADARAALAVDQARIAETRSEAATLEVQLQRRELERLRAVELSTIWRASYPLRRAGNLLPPGIRRLIRRGCKLGWWAVTLQLPRRLRRALAHARRTLPEVPVIQPVRGGRLPKALIIDAEWPDPQRDSGSVDAVNYARWLGELGYQVMFVGADAFDTPDPMLAPLRELGVACLTASQVASVEALLVSEGGGVDLCVLSRVHAGGRYYEAVRRWCPNARIVFNTTDLHHLREEREARLYGDRNGLAIAAETRAREFDLVRRADLSIVLSRFEAAELARSVHGARVGVMPLARPVAAAVPTLAGRSGIGFVGGFRHQPNVDAIGYFLNEIWPLVIQRLPDCRLEIVGADLPEAIGSKLPRGVTYLGQLADLSSWLGRLRLSVAPLRYGAGAKGKVASSLAHGLPAVISSIAAEGMGLTTNREVLIADAAPEFADAIIRLMRDDAVWTAISAEALDFARSTLSVEAGRRQFSRLLEAIDVPVQDSPP